MSVVRLENLQRYLNHIIRLFTHEQTIFPHQYRSIGIVEPDHHRTDVPVFG